MKGILIDPFNRTITEREIDPGNLQAIYDSISASCFDVVGLDDGDGIYVDDEGLYRKGQEYFALWRYPQPLAGRGLILGCDAEGKSVTPKVSLDTVRRFVRWLEPQEVVERYRQVQAAAHANQAIKNAQSAPEFHIVAMPDVEIDPDTGKARAL